MRVSENWLREWVNPAVDTQQLADTLTMAGLEVDSIEPAAPVFSGVVVAKVLEVVAHPDAKKLHICSVDDGSGNPLSVICGASNVRADLLVAFAKVDAILPNDFKIEAKTLRGVDSFGMLCSASELGLAESSQGILELPKDCELGAEVFEALALNDSVIDIDLTPNRSDCLSVQGIAREVSALLNISMEQTQIASVIDSSSQAVFPVSIEVPKDCPGYVGRVIEGVSGKVQSPMWMQEKLRRAGVRSINALIDITNYVMLELGQPMHAFDLDKLHDGIVVRFAQPEEKLELLDGQVVECSADDLVIADAKQSVALAGIMGGAGTTVDDDTANIFLESASFKPETIVGRARRYGLHTDSSHRFERGVDPQLARPAIERATQLILEIVGGTAGPVVCEADESATMQNVSINLDHAKVESILGIVISINEVEKLLTRLHCKVQIDGNSLSVVPPSFRFDLAIDVDLIEEVARLVGYENIPGKVKSISSGDGAVAISVDKLALLKQALVTRGYHEIISFSFVDQAIETLLNPGYEAKILANPISQELSVMRSSIWPGLIKAAQYNLNRQQSRVRLFECGLQFVQTNERLNQLPILAGLICGECEPQQWNAASRKVDFYDIKGDVEHLLEIAAISGGEIKFEVADDPALHPGQAAKIIVNHKTIGRIGKLHPRIQSALDIDQTFLLFELQLEDLLKESSEVVFQQLSKYPSIRRDITFIVDESVDAAKIRSNIEQMKISFLQKLEIFSVYTGKGIPDSKKSISLGLILQEFSRTLTDKEIEQTISSIISQLNNKVGAEIKS
jgi:phenylalanyl-tRNA synthetase beta chain